MNELGSQTTAFFINARDAEAAAADLRAAGITGEEIHAEHSGAAGPGFLDRVKRFFGSEDDAYAEGVLLTARGDLSTILPILQRHGGKLERDAQDAQTIRLHEEHLDVEKLPAKEGEVIVGKEVITTQKEVDIPVAREEVILNRKRVSGEQVDEAEIGDGKEIRVPVMREEVKVEKHPVVTEEISVEKHLVEEDEHVSATIRKERARLQSEGNVDTALNDVE